MDQPTPENPIVPWECPQCGAANTGEIHGTPAVLIHGTPALLTCARCGARFGGKLTFSRIQ